jgi:hypothetical protein
VNYSTYAFRLLLFVCSIGSLFSSESSLKLRARVPAVESMHVFYSNNQITITKRSNRNRIKIDSNLNIEIDNGNQIVKKQAVMAFSQHAFIELKPSQSDHIKISFIQQ